MTLPDRDPDDGGCINCGGDAFFENEDGDYICQDCLETKIDRLINQIWSQSPQMTVIYDPLEERDL